LWAVAASITPLDALAAECPAEAGDCRAITVTGSLAASIDLVIVGDGYTAAERARFFLDAEHTARGLLGSETYRAYRPVFNVWAVFTPSEQSGADDPSLGVFADTAFDASYDTSGIDYLLAVNTGKVFAELNDRFPENDLSICIVNAKPYGGSGGPVAVVSLDVNSLEIVRHELGHTLAALADEYTVPFPGYPDGDPEPNVASAAHLDPVKWEHWLTPGVEIPTPETAVAGPHEPIGAYEGARYKTTGVFRPAPACLMRELHVPFCPVCAEAMVKRFSELSRLIDAPSPASPLIVPGDGAVDLTATVPALADLTFTWTIDGELLPTSGATLTLDPAAGALAEGTHEVTLTVYDASPLVRSDPAGVMKESFTWLVAVEAVAPSSTGSGGSGGSGVGGGGEAPACSCRAAGQDGGEPVGWLLFGLLPIAVSARRRRATHLS